MIWALLALLGVPLWLIGVVLVAALRNRKKVRTDPGVFVYRQLGPKGWKRTSGHARWVSDVLIFHTGIALIRSDAQQIESTTVVECHEPPTKHLGEDVVCLAITPVGRDPITIAVEAAHQSDAMGPVGVR